MGLTDDLERLAKMRRDGALTEDEYLAAKARLLTEHSQNVPELDNERPGSDSDDAEGIGCDETESRQDDADGLEPGEPRAEPAHTSHFDEATAKEAASGCAVLLVAAIVIGVLSTFCGSDGQCVDGSDLFAPDEVGSAFIYCDDDGDGEFDRTVFKG